jgi:chromosome segregation ATPase
MASWILVKWIDEDRLGVIPCSWVVEPTLIVKDDLPKKGVCFWKKKSATFDPGILNTSDDKQELESMINDHIRDHEELDDDQGELNDVTVAEKSDDTKSKRRKDEKEDRKAKRQATLAAADDMARKIFKFQSECSSCSELTLSVSNLEKCLKEKNAQIQDLKLKMKQFRITVSKLENTLEEKDSQIQDLTTMQSEKPWQNTGSLPFASKGNVDFLESLVTFYRGHGNDVNSDEVHAHSDSENDDLSAYEKLRLNNIKENKEFISKEMKVS